jgi:hypothetical protein
MAATHGFATFATSAPLIGELDLHVSFRHFALRGSHGNSQNN